MNYLHSTAFILTHHAEQRAAQRCISAKALLLLLNHGDETAASNGCLFYALSKKIANELEKDVMDSAALAEARKLRAIVSPSGRVVTCYHSSQRFLRAHKRKSKAARRKRDLR